MEIVLRLSLALLLSLSLALLLAWGWDRSDRIPVDLATDTSIPADVGRPVALNP
jgi:hypothetical protein